MAVHLMLRPAPIPTPSASSSVGAAAAHQATSAAAAAASSSSSSPVRRSARLLPHHQPPPHPTPGASSSAKRISPTKASKHNATPYHHHHLDHPSTSTPIINPSPAPKTLKNSAPTNTTTNSRKRPRASEPSILPSLRHRKSVSAPDVSPTAVSARSAGSDHTEEEEEETPRSRRAMKRRRVVAEAEDVPTSTTAQAQKGMKMKSLRPSLPSPSLVPALAPVLMSDGIKTRSAKRKSLEGAGTTTGRDAMDEEEKMILVGRSKDQNEDEDASCPRSLKKKRRRKENDGCDNVVQPQPQPQLHIMTRSRERELEREKEKMSPVKPSKSSGPSRSRNKKATTARNSSDLSDDENEDRGVIQVIPLPLRLDSDEVALHPPPRVVAIRPGPGPRTTTTTRRGGRRSATATGVVRPITPTKVLARAVAVVDRKEEESPLSRPVMMADREKKDEKDQDQEEGKVENDNDNEDSMSSISSLTSLSSSSLEELKPSSTSALPSSSSLGLSLDSAAASASVPALSIPSSSTASLPPPAPSAPGPSPSHLPLPSSSPPSASSSSAVPVSSTSTVTVTPPSPPSSPPPSSSSSLSAPSATNKMNLRPSLPSPLPSFPHTPHSHAHPLPHVHSPLTPLREVKDKDKEKDRDVSTASSTATNVDESEGSTAPPSHTPPGSPPAFLHGLQLQLPGHQGGGQRTSPPLDAVDLGPLEKLGLPGPLLTSIPSPSPGSRPGSAAGSPVSSPPLSPIGGSGPSFGAAFGDGVSSLGSALTSKEEESASIAGAVRPGSPTPIAPPGALPTPSGNASAHPSATATANVPANAASSLIPPTPPSPTTILFSTPIALPMLPVNPFLSPFHQPDERREEHNQHQQGEQAQQHHSLEREQHQQQGQGLDLGMPVGLSMPHAAIGVGMAMPPPGSSQPPSLGLPMDVNIDMGMGFPSSSPAPMSMGSMAGDMPLNMGPVSPSMPSMIGGIGGGMSPTGMGGSMALVSESDLGFGFHGGAGGGAFGYEGVGVGVGVMQHQQQPQSHQLQQQQGMYAQHEQVYHHPSPSTPAEQMQHQSHHEQQQLMSPSTPPSQPLSLPPQSPPPPPSQIIQLQPGPQQPQPQQQQQQQPYLSLKQQKKLEYADPNPLESPPRLDKEGSVWKTACKLRVWEITRRYTPDTIRTVVAQEAHDYYSAKGVFPMGYNGSSYLKKRRRIYELHQQYFQQGSSSGRRVRSRRLVEDDGADTAAGLGADGEEMDDEFMNEKIYPFELGDDDADPDAYPYDDDDWDDEDDDEDEEEEEEEYEEGDEEQKALLPGVGVAEAEGIPSTGSPLSSAAPPSGPSSSSGVEDVAVLSGDEDAEGEMEVDIEAFSDPSFNRELSSPTSPIAPASPMSPGDSLIASFYIPPVNVSMAMQMDVDSPSAVPASPSMGLPSESLDQQPPSLQDSQQMQMDPQQDQVQPEHEHPQYQHPMQIQLPPPANQSFFASPPSPILPLPPPRLDTIRVGYLRTADVGTKMTGRGTPADRARAAVWAHGWNKSRLVGVAASSSSVNHGDGEEGTEAEKRAKPRLRLDLKEGEDKRLQQDPSLRLTLSGEEGGSDLIDSPPRVLPSLVSDPTMALDAVSSGATNNASNGGNGVPSSSEASTSPTPSFDHTQWEAFLASLDDRSSSASLSSPPRHLSQIMPENGNVVSAPSIAGISNSSIPGPVQGASSGPGNMLPTSSSTLSVLTSPAAPASLGLNLGGFVGVGVVGMGMFDMGFMGWFGPGAGAGTNATSTSGGLNNGESSNGNLHQDSSLPSSLIMHSTPPSSPTHTSHSPPSLSPPISPVAAGTSTLSFALG